MSPARTGAQSTAAVLWLMILLVFVPIALAHGVALLTESRDSAHAGSAPVGSG